jgi:hypothetical protein
MIHVYATHFLKVEKPIDLLCNMDEKQIKFNVINFLTLHLKDTKKASFSYRNLALAAIKHFYEMNDITLPWHKIHKFLGEKRSLTTTIGIIHTRKFGECWRLQI